MELTIPWWEKDQWDPHLIYSISTGSVYFEVLSIGLHLELPLWWFPSTSLNSPPSATIAQRSHFDILRQKWETPSHCWLLRHFPCPSFRSSVNLDRAVPTRHVGNNEKYNMTCYICTDKLYQSKTQQHCIHLQSKPYTHKGQMKAVKVRYKSDLAILLFSLCVFLAHHSNAYHLWTRLQPIGSFQSIVLFHYKPHSQRYENWK